MLCKLCKMETDTNQGPRAKNNTFTISDTCTLINSSSVFMIIWVVITAPSETTLVTVKHFTLSLQQLCGTLPTYSQLTVA